MKTASAVVLGVLLGAFLAAGGSPLASGAPTNPNVKTLMQRPLAEEFTPDREILVDLVEIAPNTALDRHWHPGEEFHYYLEGEVEIRIDGEPPVIGTPGTVGHVPFKKWHTAIAGEKGAKILVFRVHTEGAPWRYLEEEPTPGQ
jgi:quercetin dioxygenase-like cupin family protein